MQYDSQALHMQFAWSITDEMSIVSEKIVFEIFLIIEVVTLLQWQLEMNTLVWLSETEPSSVFEKMI